MRLLSLKTGFLVGIVCLFFLLCPAVAQGAGNLYISPGSKSLGVGQSVTMSIRVNTGGEAVNAVEVNLSYPAAQLDLVGINAGGSAFPIQAQSGGGGGNVAISRGIIGGGSSGDLLVATVTFKAKAGSGTASITFAGGSAIVRGSDQANIMGGGSGATITFITPTPTPTPAPTAPPTPTPTPDTTKPIISEVMVKDVTFNQVTIAWKTDEVAMSVVDYGLSGAYGITESNPDRVTDHAMALSSAVLLPGVTYHYRVRSVDLANNETVSEDGSFTMKGYSVKLLLKDSSGKPLRNAAVRLLLGQPKSATTDQDGWVTYDNVPSGNLALTVTYAGGTQAATFIVVDGTEEQLKSGQAPTQELEVKVAAMHRQVPWLPIIILTLLLAVLVAAGWWIKTRGWPKRWPTSWPRPGGGSGSGLTLSASAVPSSTDQVDASSQLNSVAWSLPEPSLNTLPVEAVNQDVAQPITVESAPPLPSPITVPTDNHAWSGSTATVADQVEVAGLAKVEDVMQREYGSTT